MAKTRKKSIQSSLSSRNNKTSNKFNWVGLLVILLVLTVAPVYVYHSHKGSDKNSSNSSSTSNASSSGDTNDGGSNVASDGSGTLSVEPGSQPVSEGSILTIALYEDSKSDSVNAVQTNLTYPADKLKLVKIDTSGSAFAIKAQEDGGSGSIKIARGTIKPVTGKQLVARAQFRAKANSGTANIEFTDGSGIVRSSDNKEILHDTNGQQYMLTQ
jgi:uncharacterized protein (UPF0333 family)